MGKQECKKKSVKITVFTDYDKFRYNELFPVIRWIYAQVLLYIAAEIGG